MRSQHEVCQGPSLHGLLVMALLCATLHACSNNAVRWEHDTYIVRSGDTLYAIAWHFGIDHRELARLNGIGSGEVIYPGQTLRLKPGASRGVASRPPVATRPKPRTEPSRSAEEPANRRPPPKWQWPAEGKVIAAFGDPKSVGKGIDIAGRKGASVYAAADGRVVYAGSGLVGYGKLIIIKHSETYLSAYGHNATLLAGQGDTVSRGERIAEMGTGPRRTAMLHFEIRVNGEAVDPVRFLPRR